MTLHHVWITTRPPPAPVIVLTLGWEVQVTWVFSKGRPQTGWGPQGWGAAANRDGLRGGVSNFSEQPQDPSGTVHGARGEAKTLAPTSVTPSESSLDNLRFSELKHSVMSSGHSATNRCSNLASHSTLVYLSLRTLLLVEILNWMCHLPRMWFDEDQHARLTHSRIHECLYPYPL